MTETKMNNTITKNLVYLCRDYGVEYIILSPGSRNAPLIISFAGCGFFKCLSITDERSAAYFALGLSKVTRKPVAVVCTSGTAALNYAPAVAEAYYQKIPLIIITADRPKRLIDQADGQTIQQQGIYENFIRFQCTIPEKDDNDNLFYANRLINEAFQKAIGKPKGPVHINIPLIEPLYEKIDFMDSFVSKKITKLNDKVNLYTETVDNLDREINAYKRIMILVGADYPNGLLADALSRLALKGIVVITETLSNCHDQLFFENTDRILASIAETEYLLFSPDLLITFDTPVLSRLIKKMLQSEKPKSHWHFTDSNTIVDTFNSLTRMIYGNAAQILSQLEKRIGNSRVEFYETWKTRDSYTKIIHNKFTENLPWCDLQLFKILSEIKIHTKHIHLGNSTPVRYAQLFDWKDKTNHLWYANRGTSGIDGCVSTAVGSAYGSKESTLLIIGDISFIYDCNGLWHNYLPNNLRIIVINNGGGGIFRFLQGPEESGYLEEFFETTQKANCRGIANTFGCAYFYCNDEKSFLKVLYSFFYKSSKPKLLEVFTPKEENGTILKKYFKYLKNNV